MNIEQNNMLVLPDSIGDNDFAKIAQSFGQDDGLQRTQDCRVWLLSSRLMTMKETVCLKGILGRGLKVVLSI